MKVGIGESDDRDDLTDVVLPATGCSALHMPKPTPIRMPSNIAKNASSKVTGSAVPINVETGSRETSEMPRFPLEGMQPRPVLLEGGLTERRSNG